MTWLTKPLAALIVSRPDVSSTRFKGMIQSDAAIHEPPRHHYPHEPSLSLTHKDMDIHHCQLYLVDLGGAGKRHMGPNTTPGVSRRHRVAPVEATPRKTRVESSHDSFYPELVVVDYDYQVELMMLMSHIGSSGEEGQLELQQKRCRNGGWTLGFVVQQYQTMS